MKPLPQVTFIMKVYTNQKNWRKPLKESIQQLANNVDGNVVCYVLEEPGRIKADEILMGMKLK